MSQVLFAIVFLAAFGGYWWYSQGRKGNRAVHEHLGLVAGEEIKTYMTGHHHIALGAADVGAAALGMQRVGKNVTVALATNGALVLRTEGDQPLRPAKGSLVLNKVAENVDTLSGTGGTKEPADAIEISGPNMPTMTIALARSSAELIDQWNRG